MAIIGIIGTEEADANMVTDGLIDLRDRAANEGDAFWAIVGLTPESPEIVATIIEWFIEEGVAYDLVVHPEVFDAVPEEYRNGADKVTKIKGVDNKVADRLLAEEGTHLLLLIGAENTPEDDLTAVAQKAHDGDIVVMDLADSLNEFIFGEPDVEDAAADEEPDYDALGEAADGGDAEAQGVLEDLARAVDIDPDEVATYAELAEMLKPTEPEPEKPAAKKAASPKATPASKATKWTEAALNDLPPKDVKAIAIASGIEGAGKMGLPALKAALVGKPMPAAEEPEPEEEKPAAKPAAKGKGKTPVIGEPLAGMPATGDTELDHILASFNQSFIRLVNYLKTK